MEGIRPKETASKEVINHLNQMGIIRAMILIGLREYYLSRPEEKRRAEVEYLRKAKDLLNTSSIMLGDGLLPRVRASLLEVEFDPEMIVTTVNREITRFSHEDYAKKAGFSINPIEWDEVANFDPTQPEYQDLLK